MTVGHFQSNLLPVQERTHVCQAIAVKSPAYARNQTCLCGSIELHLSQSGSHLQPLSVAWQLYSSAECLHQCCHMCALCVAEGVCPCHAMPCCSSAGTMVPYMHTMAAWSCVHSCAMQLTLVWSSEPRLGTTTSGVAVPTPSCIFCRGLHMCYS